MKIALLSYECAPDTADGGIATYISHAARLLHARGHHVEIFAASRSRTCTLVEEGRMVHRVRTEKREDFPALAAPLFAARHREVHFDVLEGPDYLAEAREAIRVVPDIPLVVRLHTPAFLAYAVRDVQLAPDKISRLRRRAARHHDKPAYNPGSSLNEMERIHIQQADRVVGISKAITEIVSRSLRLPEEQVCSVPNAFLPSPGLLAIPYETGSKMVTYIGRLQARKGVLDIARAIPIILRAAPGTYFRFLGRPLASPLKGIDMLEYLTSQLHNYRSHVEFLPQRPNEELPETLRESDICLFPSQWENFPYVCLEAMAAARPIVGSLSGGMPEILNQGEAGLLVPPHCPEAIAQSVLKLLHNPELRLQLSQAARSRAVTTYSPHIIGPLMEQAFVHAISRRKELGTRLPG